MQADLKTMTRVHRRALSARLSDGLVVLGAARPAHRNGDQEFRYRQDSSFLWTTGIEAPGYALVLDPRRGDEWLLCPRLTQKHAVWVGHIPSLGEAKAEFGVAHTLYHDELAGLLARLGKGRRVYADRRAAPLVRRALRKSVVDTPGL